MNRVQNIPILVGFTTQGGFQLGIICSVVIGRRSTTHDKVHHVPSAPRFANHPTQLGLVSCRQDNHHQGGGGGGFLFRADRGPGQGIGGGDRGLSVIPKNTLLFPRLNQGFLMSSKVFHRYIGGVVNGWSFVTIITIPPVPPPPPRRKPGTGVIFFGDGGSFGVKKDTPGDTLGHGGPSNFFTVFLSLDIVVLHAITTILSPGFHHIGILLLGHPYFGGAAVGGFSWR